MKLNNEESLILADIVNLNSFLDQIDKTPYVTVLTHNIEHQVTASCTLKVPVFVQQEFQKQTIKKLKKEIKKLTKLTWEIYGDNSKPLFNEAWKEEQAADIHPPITELINANDYEEEENIYPPIPDSHEEPKTDETV